MSHVLFVRRFQLKLTGISYNPKTGVISRNGKPVMGSDSQEYRKIKINRRWYRQHRVAWFLAYGFWPKYIDHINKDKKDNRLHNLRACTASMNKLNVGLQSNNTTGVKGVTFDSNSGKWRVQYRNKHIGLFNSFNEAVQRRQVCQQELKVI
jgi:hypothetical protein